MRLDRRDVDARADHEHALRRRALRFHRRDHVGEDGHGIGAVQAAAEHLDDRAVVAADHRQRRGVAVDEQQAGALVSDRATRGLRQCACGVQFGYQHDVSDAAGGQGVAQRGGLDVVTPRDADRLEDVAALGCTLLGAEHRRDDLVGRC